MEFGLFMMPLHPPYRSYADSYDRDLALLVEADRLGFHEAWIGEHHSGGWETMPAPEMALSMAAAQAHRIRLGTSVVSLPFPSASISS